MTCVLSGVRRSTVSQSRSLIHFATLVQNGRTAENEDLRSICSFILHSFEVQNDTEGVGKGRSVPLRVVVYLESLQNKEHLRRGSVLSQIHATWGISSGHFDVCKIAKAQPITQQIAALNLPANLLELRRG
jgi:hypothetical protein